MDIWSIIMWYCVLVFVIRWWQILQHPEYFDPHISIELMLNRPFFVFGRTPKIAQNATGTHSAYCEKCTLLQTIGSSACAVLESSWLSKSSNCAHSKVWAGHAEKGKANITIWWCLEWTQATLLLAIFSCSPKVIQSCASSKCSYKAAGLVSTTFCLCQGCEGHTSILAHWLTI